MLNVINLTDYLTYLELEIRGRKPKVGWHILFKWNGRIVKAIVEEVGRTVLVRRVKDV